MAFENTIQVIDIEIMEPNELGQYKVETSGEPVYFDKWLSVLEYITQEWLDCKGLTPDAAGIIVREFDPIKSSN